MKRNIWKIIKLKNIREFLSLFFPLKRCFSPQNNKNWKIKNKSTLHALMCDFMAAKYFIHVAKHRKQFTSGFTWIEQLPKYEEKIHAAKYKIKIDPHSFVLVEYEKARHFHQWSETIYEIDDHSSRKWERIRRLKINEWNPLKINEDNQKNNKIRHVRQV